MSRIIYKIGSLAYFSAIRIASLWNKKAKKWVNGRKNWEKHLQSSLPPKKSKRFWIHCASLGEFEQARPFIEHLKNQGDYSVIISFFSPSGYEIRKDYDQADAVVYLPSDTRKNAKTFLDLVDPDVVYFVKYEFWASFIFETKARKIPLYGISVILRPDQVYFKSFGGYFKRILKAFDHLYVQNKETGKLLESIAITSYSEVGDTRFNRVIQIAQTSKENEIIAHFKGTHKLLVLGSVWKEDMEVVSPFLNSDLPSNFKILLAPHNIDDKSIHLLTKDLDEKDLVYYTRYGDQDQSKKILVLNTMGNLASSYKYGSIAYVGGGFKTGLHNTLEPASHGLPVIFGPQFKKFDEAKMLIQHGAAKSISSTSAFKNAFLDFNAKDVKSSIRQLIAEKGVDLDQIKTK